MLMNRIGPSSSELYVANADGSGERKFLESGAFEYHPPWSSDGNWLVFTSRVMGMVSPTSFAAVPTGPALNRWSPAPRWTTRACSHRTDRTLRSFRRFSGTVCGRTRCRSTFQRNSSKGSPHVSSSGVLFSVFFNLLFAEGIFITGGDHQNAY